MAVEAMKAGAVDFIEKPFDDNTIVDAIRRASERLSDASSPIESGEDIRARISTLSDRERQVLTAVVAGQPNKAIAFALDISPRTVEVHRANVMAKMQARSLPELVRMSLAAEAAD
ncbi:Transcriptional regulatory protein FixJ [compost metagenome]